ncbi:MAG TPA: long-chain fatty acid--CoA ligase [Gemmatimonadales bacterium]|nr:long-chain fatty acid--CoA ligase [Gemmatimonadales bacterium]
MTSPKTLTELFFGAMDRLADRPVLMRAKRNNRWIEISPREFLDQVHDLSLGLTELGIQPGDRVALLSENRPEWAVSDYACLAARCADVPIYPTLPAGQTEYLLRDSGAVAVCLSTRTQLAKIQSIRENLPALRHVIVFDPEPGGTEGVLSLAEVQAIGRAARNRHAAWRERALAVQPTDLATIIYTSGTTGEPKGVMLTHGNLASNVVACLQVLDMRPEDECLSFLPLSHVFERTAGHYVMLHAGILINYAKSVESVSNDLLDRRPTVVTSVPRLFEKIYTRVIDKAAGASATKRRLFRWAKRVGDAWTDAVLRDGRAPAGLALQHAIADRLVFAKLRERTGGRIRFFISGGAPLAPEVARFFYASGLMLLEGYGLTETSPVVSVNVPGAHRIGSVGKPLPGVEVRIAEDGEILTRGPHVMMGYFHKPEATAESIDADGWFRTGDIGRLDEEGFVYITDRKKDLIVTAGGKNIAPQPIEGRLKTNPFIANAVMLGDRRKFPIALLVPEFERLREWAATEGIDQQDDAALASLPAARSKMEMEAKKHLRDLASFEVPKKFLILERDFSIERGELTPKLSVRRRAVEDNFRDRISALYNDSRD